MQRTSALYRQILATEPHWFETVVVIGESGDLVTEMGDRIIFGTGEDSRAIVVARAGADSGYPEDQLFSVRTSMEMFRDDPEIGHAISQEIELSMIKPAGDIVPMGLVIPFVRVCSETDKSEWIQQGVFYIDTREISDNHDNLVTIIIHGYDAMLRSEQYYPTESDTLDWSGGTVSDTTMVSRIAQIMDVNVDARTWTLMNGNYQIPLPLNYTLRELLGYIASMYLGCFIMNDIGELRLVSLLELPEETSLLVDNAGDCITFGVEPNEVCSIKV